MTTDEFAEKHGVRASITRGPLPQAESRFKIRKQAAQVHRGEKTKHKGVALLNDPSAPGWTVMLAAPDKPEVFLSFFTRKAEPTSQDVMSELAAYAGRYRDWSSEKRLDMPQVITSDLMVLSVWLGAAKYSEFQQVGADLLANEYKTEI